MLTADQALHASNIAKKILINIIPMCVIFTLYISNITNYFIIFAITILVITYFYIRYGIKNPNKKFTINFRNIWLPTTIVFVIFSFLYYKRLISADAYIGAFFIATCFPAQFLFLYELRKMQHVDS